MPTPACCAVAVLVELSPCMIRIPFPDVGPARNCFRSSGTCSRRRLGLPTMHADDIDFGRPTGVGCRIRANPTLKRVPRRTRRACSPSGTECKAPAELAASGSSTRSRRRSRPSPAAAAPRLGPRRDGHWEEAQRGDERCHQDRPQPGRRALMHRVKHRFSLAPQPLDELDDDEAVEHRDTGQRDEADRQSRKSRSCNSYIAGPSWRT